MTLLDDACGVCGRFVPQDKLMVFDEQTHAPFHYACYQAYKQKKEAAKIIRDNWNKVLLEKQQGEQLNG